jgi:hypothetical protein
VAVTVPSLQSVEPSPLDTPAATGANAVSRGTLAYEHRNVPLAAQGLQLGVAEESDLVRVGDVILGACAGSGWRGTRRRGAVSYHCGRASD